ncbi:MAG: helix-turn-helix transcriptional regulator [Bacillota bacterium]
MKVDRLIAITVHLLNHQTVSASALAERFEVSRRTIQRDIDVLSSAGIPIVSTYGSSGGYEIMDGFKLQKQMAGADDYQNIVSALKGLATAYGNQKIRATLEKVLATSPQSEQRVFIDLSAAREGAATDSYLKTIETAIHNRTTLQIEYTGAEQSVSVRTVEPLALTYQWYAWYLFAYCTTKQDYRLFKLARITQCAPSRAQFSWEHGTVEELLQKQLSSDSRRYLEIKLRCRKEVRQQIMEYLNGKIIEEHSSGDFIYSMHLPANERLWFSLLLGFGNQVQVIEPEELRVKLRAKAEEILATY